MKTKIKINKMKINKKLIIAQGIFILLILGGIYFVYPQTTIKVTGDIIKFDSRNANIIIISKNPALSNPNYIDLNDVSSFNLEPGTYYWKPANNFIKGFTQELVIDSEASIIIESENETRLVNVGNVKLNVTKQGDVMVGHIILNPDESQEIENQGKYIGEQI